MALTTSITSAPGHSRLQKATYSRSGPQTFSTQVIGYNSQTQSSMGGVGTGYFNIPLNASQSAQISPGNLGRDTFTGPSWSNLDFSVVKDTRITESKTLQFRAEFFNILNEPTFALPNPTLSNPAFGLSTSTQTLERQIQFGLRFIF